VPDPGIAQAQGSAPRADTSRGASRVNRLVFYPLVIGLFLAVDTVLRVTGH
jgi:hypothetical protein